MEIFIFFFVRAGSLYCRRFFVAALVTWLAWRNCDSGHNWVGYLQIGVNL